MKRRVAIASAFALSGAAYACGIFPSVDGLTGGTPDAAADTSDATPRLDATADARDASTADGALEAAPCPSGRGPAMISVGAFCIDSTEVTAEQYAEFLADAGAAPQNSPPGCEWNTTVQPQPAGGGIFDPGGFPNLPVNSVDWCDAYAFCKWAGKRLCGAIDGGAFAPDAYTDTQMHQWGFACSENGSRKYPYGAVYDGTKGCNGHDAGLKATPLLVDVGSRAGCVGGFDGLHDMSGNVWEWVDACGECDAGRCCIVLGGSYGNSEPNLQCAPPNPASANEDQRYEDLAVGFRCCSP